MRLHRSSRWRVTPTASLFRSTVSGIVVRGGGTALSLAVAVFLARTLGPQELGTYQAVLSTCIVIAGLSIATAAQPATRRIASLPVGDRRAIAREVGLAHLQAGALLLGVELVLAAGILSGIGPESARRVLPYAAVLVPTLALPLLRQWIALPSSGTAGSLAPEQIGLPVVFLGLAAAVATRGGLSASGALAVYAAAGGLVWLVTCWRSGLLDLLVCGLRPAPSIGAVRARIRDGQPFVLVTLVDLLPTYVAVPLVAVLLNPDGAGRLSIATQFAALVVIPLQMVSLTIMPRCAQLYRSLDIRGLERLVRSASTISVGLGIGIAAVLGVLLDSVLGLLGPGFADSGRLLPILVAGQLFGAFCGPNGPALRMVGLERDVARAQSLTTVLHLGAVAWTAYTGSVVGVAVAIAATTVLRNVLLSTILYRKVGILTLPYLRRRHTRGH